MMTKAIWRIISFAIFLLVLRRIRRRHFLIFFQKNIIFQAGDQGQGFVEAFRKNNFALIKRLTTRHSTHTSVIVHPFTVLTGTGPSVRGRQGFKVARSEGAYHGAGVSESSKNADFLSVILPPASSYLLLRYMVANRNDADADYGQIEHWPHKFHPLLDFLKRSLS